VSVKKEEEKFAPSGLFEGILSLESVIKAIESGKSDRRVEKVCFDRGRSEKKSREFDYIKRKSQQLGFEIEITDKETIDSMCTGNSHGGVIAFCTERTYPELDEISLPSDGYYVMLDGIEDPYNFGYAVRSLYAAGVDGIIVPPRNWMSAAGVVCRASAGASELCDVYVADPQTAADICKKRGYTIVCADKDDSVSVYETKIKKPLLLIVGGEKRGISRAVLDKADLIVRLDYGREFKAALSAASAASIIAFEIFRQNNF